jgi:hypothetical protein
MKKIGIILSVLIAAPLSFAYYYWQQATKLPEWYAANETTDHQQSNSAEQLEQSNSAEQLELEIPQEMLEKGTKASSEVSNGKSVEVKLDEKELNDLLVSKISKDVVSGELSQAVKGSNTTIKNGKIESGAVLSLSEIPVDQLKANEKEALQKAIKTFPALKNKEVYVGIEGKPRAENGQLAFDDNTSIKLGNLSFTVLELSNRLGVPKESVEKAINLDLKELNVGDMD